MNAPRDLWEIEAEVRRRYPRASAVLTDRLVKAMCQAEMSDWLASILENRRQRHAETLRLLAQV